MSPLRVRSGEPQPVPDAAPDPALGKAIEDARAEMERLVQLGELQNDPIRHPIRALSVHLDALLKVSMALSQVPARQSGAALTDKQAEDIGRRLLGACQAWSGSLVRASLVRSWALLAATLLAAMLVGGLVSWLAFGRPLNEVCMDQNGGRLCGQWVISPGGR